MLALKADLDRLEACSWSEVSKRWNLRNRIHRLAGSGGSMGFEALSRVSGYLDSLLEAVELSGLDEARQAQIRLLMGDLFSVGNAVRVDDSSLVSGPDVLEPVESTRVTSVSPLVLVVGNDSVLSDFYAHVLEASGARVWQPGDGNGFFRATCAAVPDVVLMDPALEEERGLERTGRMWGGFPDVPVLFLSSFRESSVPAKLYQKGADGYLEKPVTSDRLVSAVFSILFRRGIYAGMAHDESGLSPVGEAF